MPGGSLRSAPSVSATCKDTRRVVVGVCEGMGGRRSEEREREERRDGPVKRRSDGPALLGFPAGGVLECVRRERWVARGDGEGRDGRGRRGEAVLGGPHAHVVHVLETLAHALWRERGGADGGGTVMRWQSLQRERRWLCMKMCTCRCRWQVHARPRACGSGACAESLAPSNARSALRSSPHPPLV